MMMDVDTHYRRFGPLIELHCSIAYVLHSCDQINRPDAYDHQLFADGSKTKIKLTEGDTKSALPLITRSVIDGVTFVACTENQLALPNSQLKQVSS